MRTTLSVWLEMIRTHCIVKSSRNRNGWRNVGHGTEFAPGGAPTHTLLYLDSHESSGSTCSTHFKNGRQSASYRLSLSSTEHLSLHFCTKKYKLQVGGFMFDSIGDDMNWKQKLKEIWRSLILMSSNDLEIWENVVYNGEIVNTIWTRLTCSFCQCGMI